MTRMPVLLMTGGHDQCWIGHQLEKRRWALEPVVAPAQGQQTGPRRGERANTIASRDGLTRVVPAFVVAAIMAASLSSAKAATILTENFNSYSGNQNANQADTGLPVAFGGNVPGWSHAGTNALHAVDQGGGNWAIMFYANNTITLASGIVANTLGSSYVVSFDYGTATYGSTQQTNASDGLVVEVLRADNSILAQQSYLPGAWGPGNFDLQAGLQGNLNYIGDGSGDVHLQISTVNPGADRFGGSIDNVSVSDASSAPEPGGFTSLGLGLAGLTLLGLLRRRASVSPDAATERSR